MTTAGIARAVMVASTAYFVLWAISQIGVAAVAAVATWRYRRRHTRRARAIVDRISLPFVSIVVPAYNEELTVVESIRALLALEYDPYEIVIVNDGSTDGTLAVLQATFQLLPGPLAYVRPLESATVRSVYRSTAETRLVVVDKENGGCKADASNAGINASSGKLVLVIDADTVLEPDALSRAVVPFLEDRHTIAVGCNVAIANGCQVRDGRLANVALPRSWLARFQIVEYMRAFQVFRVACAEWNGLLILSGAFGLFRREAVIEAGGYDRAAIGEDMDLTMRLQRLFRRRKQPFRIAYVPDPLCATQAPEDWASLQSQRLRWRRGLMQVLWRNRGMIGHPRYGVAGLVTLPYVFLFEAVGPVLEFASYGLLTIGVAFDIVDGRPYATVLAIWILLGTTISTLAVLLNDVATRRYMTGRDLTRLLLVAVLENCGYRQLNSWWATIGSFQALTGTSGWGTLKRRQFERADV